MLSSVPTHCCQKHLSKQQLSQNLLSLFSEPFLCPWFSGGTAQCEGWDLLAILFGNSVQKCLFPRTLLGWEEVPDCSWKHEKEMWQRANAVCMPLLVPVSRSG